MALGAPKRHASGGWRPLGLAAGVAAAVALALQHGFSDAPAPLRSETRAQLQSSSGHDPRSAKCLAARARVRPRPRAHRGRGRGRGSGAGFRGGYAVDITYKERCLRRRGTSMTVRQGGTRHDRNEEALGLLGSGAIGRLQDGERPRSLDDHDQRALIASACQRALIASSLIRRALIRRALVRRALVASACRRRGAGSARSNSERAGCRRHCRRTSGGLRRAHGPRDRGWLQLRRPPAEGQ